MIRAQDNITIDVTGALEGIATAMQALREIELPEQRWEDDGGAVVHREERS